MDAVRRAYGFAGSEKRRGLRGWIGLFADPASAAATLVALGVFIIVVPRVVEWAVLDSTLFGASRGDCAPGGACWAMVTARLGQFVYGFYPADQRWRIDAGFALFVLGIGGILCAPLPWRGRVALAVAGLYPVLAYGLFYGGWFGLSRVSTDRWGGLFVTCVVAISGMAASSPAGVLLALGRRSRAPLIAAASAVFIEVFRGVPLIAILFFAVVVMPLLMPDGGSVDLFARVLIGIGLYASAYMAEVVRGGLQAIAAGQYEAAAALGLGYWTSMRRVILPQTLRLAVPSIVNTFLQLIKDTSLVLIVGVFDLLGSVQVAVTDPNWIGTALEGYVFAGAVYFAISFAVSRAGAWLERRLAAGTGRE